MQLARRTNEEAEARRQQYDDERRERERSRPSCQCACHAQRTSSVGPTNTAVSLVVTGPEGCPDGPTP
jgi:hypothetical protein